MRCCLNFILSHRLARRCHLTEQIGARRRDLYSTDTWTPVDDHIVWPYTKRDFESTKQVVQIKSKQEALSIESSDGLNYSTTSADGEATSELDMCARYMDVFTTILDATPENSSSEVYLKLLEDVKKMVAQLKPPKLDPVTFLDDFFCLFYRSGLVKLGPKLAASLTGEFPRGALLSIAEYVESVSVPSRSELNAVKEAVNGLDVSNLGPQQLREVVRLYIFLNHPVVACFLNTYKPSDEVAARNKVYPSKAIKKEIAQSVPPPLKVIATEALRRESITESLVYRMTLIMPTLARIEHINAVEKLIKKASPEIMEEVTFLNSLNEEFRRSKFPSKS